MQKLCWKTEKRKIKNLLPYQNNPRSLSKKQEALLRKSIEEFNLVEIPVIDIDKKIISGHQRIKILLLLNRGEEQIDVRVPNRKLTAKEFIKYNLGSNKISGEWDWNDVCSIDEDILFDQGFTIAELTGDTQSPKNNAKQVRKMFEFHKDEFDEVKKAMNKLIDKNDIDYEDNIRMRGAVISEICRKYLEVDNENS